MANRVKNVNLYILKQCRMQIGIDLSEVSQKVKKIEDIEQGILKPTIKQLDTLSNLYKVPRWVFISETLPEKYQFNKEVPAFREFSDHNPDLFKSHKVRSLTTKVERFRKLILELKDDMGESVEDFRPPDIGNINTLNRLSEKIREWLGVRDNPDFDTWKELLEEKGVFVFLTSKYKSWSHVDRSLLRGLAIYHKKLPIIIINDSDAKKAQSFTLFHGLGHLLKKQNAIDDWEFYKRKIESWCDQLAGNILLPAESVRKYADCCTDLNSIKSIARNFNVSSYAYLVRLRQLKIIDQERYLEFESKLTDEFKRIQKKMKENKSGPARNRPKEIIHQYGHIYTGTLFQAYHNNEIGLYKLASLFNVKKPSYIIEMEGQIQ